VFKNYLQTKSHLDTIARSSFDLPQSIRFNQNGLVNQRCDQSMAKIQADIKSLSHAGANENIEA
jgi:hypothetical protein